MRLDSKMPPKQCFEMVPAPARQRSYEMHNASEPGWEPNEMSLPACAHDVDSSSWGPPEAASKY